jgi:hypothetical protein
MLIQKISDVVSWLDEIVLACENTQNRMGYFAALYKRMTVSVATGITNGSFQDGARMEKLDLVFAQRYLDAFDAFQHKAVCSSSWQYAFDNCADTSLTVIQHLLMGINTHINLDLAIAAAAIAPGDSIFALEEDFNRINNVIAALVNDIQESLCQVWAPMRLLTAIANHRQEAVLNFNIDIARKTAWANALIMANMNVSQLSDHIKGMDATVNILGQKIHSPGMLAELLLRSIRFTEFEDIARTTRLIDTTVVN